MIWLLLALGCGSGEETVEVAAADLDVQECAVCGMTVRDQPSPRGQAVHRDGTHAFACSLGDLRAYLAAPSPLGPPVAVYVEALPAEPDLSATDPLPWVAAGDAAFVSGVERPMVMGLPLLSFADRATAEAYAAGAGGRVHTWEALVETQFDTVPEPR